MSVEVVTGRRVVIQKSVVVDGRRRRVEVQEGDVRANVEVPGEHQGTCEEVSLSAEQCRAWAAYFAAAADALEEAERFRGVGDRLEVSLDGQEVALSPPEPEPF